MNLDQAKKIIISVVTEALENEQKLRCIKNFFEHKLIEKFI